jgi:hypothetical protein
VKDFEIQVDPATGAAFTTIGGVRVEIATEEECEAATVVVCGPDSHFPDDVHTLCAFCGAGVVHRPYAPKAPPKICITCAAAMAARKES